MATKAALKVVPKEPATAPSKKRERTLDSLEVRIRKVEIKTSLLKAEDLLTEVWDAQKVVDVATEAWGEENEHSASSCVGVLDLLNYKLQTIARETKGIMGLLGHEFPTVRRA